VKLINARKTKGLLKNANAGRKCQIIPGRIAEFNSCVRKKWIFCNFCNKRIRNLQNLQIVFSAKRNSPVNPVAGQGNILFYTWFTLFNSERNGVLLV
jgi:hypothetical protein